MRQLYLGPAAGYQGRRISEGMRALREDERPPSRARASYDLATREERSVLASLYAEEAVAAIRTGKPFLCREERIERHRRKRAEAAAEAAAKLERWREEARLAQIEREAERAARKLEAERLMAEQKDRRAEEQAAREREEAEFLVRWTRQVTLARLSEWDREEEIEEVGLNAGKLYDRMRRLGWSLAEMRRALRLHNIPKDYQGDYSA